MLSNTKMSYFMVALSTDPIDDLENIENGTRMFVMDTGAKYIYDEENHTWRDMETGESAVPSNKKFNVAITSGESSYQTGIRVIDNKVSGTLVYHGGYSVELSIDPGIIGSGSAVITLDGNRVSGNTITLDVTDNRDTHEITISANGYTTETIILEMSKLFLQPVKEDGEDGEDKNANSRVGTAVVGIAVVGVEGDPNAATVGSAVVGEATVGSEGGSEGGGETEVTWRTFYEGTLTTVDGEGCSTAQLPQVICVTPSAKVTVNGVEYLNSCGYNENNDVLYYGASWNSDSDSYDFSEYSFCLVDGFLDTQEPGTYTIKVEVPDGWQTLYEAVNETPMVETDGSGNTSAEHYYYDIPYTVSECIDTIKVVFDNETYITPLDSGWGNFVGEDTPYSIGLLQPDSLPVMVVQSSESHSFKIEVPSYVTVVSVPDGTVDLDGTQTPAVDPGR